MPNGDWLKRTLAKGLWRLGIMWGRPVRWLNQLADKLHPPSVKLTPYGGQPNERRRRPF